MYDFSVRYNYRSYDLGKLQGVLKFLEDQADVQNMEHIVVPDLLEQLSKNPAFVKVKYEGRELYLSSYVYRENSEDGQWKELGFAFRHLLVGVEDPSKQSPVYRLYYSASLMAQKMDTQSESVPLQSRTCEQAKL